MSPTSQFPDPCADLPHRSAAFLPPPVPIDTFVMSARVNDDPRGMSPWTMPTPQSHDERTLADM